MKKLSVLCDALPREIRAGNRSYPVFTDFRRWILVSEIICEERESPDIAAECALCTVSPSLYGEYEKTRDPELLAEAFRGIMWFFSCGRFDCDETNEKSDTVGDPEHIFDFEYYAELILSSFIAAYGIDLTCGEMHWWKFSALLKTLPPECELMRTVSLRMTDTSAIEDDSLRRRVRRAKAAVRIKKNQNKSFTERHGQQN